jgi:hypothetical protein
VSIEPSKGTNQFEPMIVEEDTIQRSVTTKVIEDIEVKRVEERSLGKRNRDDKEEIVSFSHIFVTFFREKNLSGKQKSV